MAAFVLGNGVSRQTIDVDTLMTVGTVYGCNALFRTHTPHVLVATDTPISQTIQQSGYSLTNKFYTRMPLKNMGALTVPRKYHGFSSGPIAVGIAALDQHSKIYLVGFDMGPNEHGAFNNMYADTPFYKPLGSVPTFTGNWIKQILQIAQDFPQTEFVRVFGATTARVQEFDKIHNIQSLGIADFVARINNVKDL
jgi:hypothetical protein